MVRISNPCNCTCPIQAWEIRDAAENLGRSLKKPATIVTICSVTAVIFGIIAISMKAHPALSEVAKKAFMGAGISTLVIGSTLLIGQICGRVFCGRRQIPRVPSYERIEDFPGLPDLRMDRYRPPAPPPAHGANLAEVNADDLPVDKPEDDEKFVGDIVGADLESQRKALEALEKKRELDLVPVKDSTNKYECPLTLERLHKLSQPCFFAEDGNTYERKDLEDALSRQPGVSPKSNLMVTNKPTLVDYRSRNFATCPLTRCPETGNPQPFKEAYFCIQDGYTYERETLKEYVEKWNLNNPHSLTIPSPGNPSLQLKAITVYPNIALFKAALPKELRPIRFF